ncbi:hypothetical protein CRM22_004385 [Opisthorchis felineus]|uniref:ARID domain-containing protein n=2 Tax=Opisthorchis felineus TaxID=147828 RepID=A0A4S2LWG9_OPIFE|nr:hypothetical protein CRM22_004385 [Opisthorchis felineus]
MGTSLNFKLSSAKPKGRIYSSSCLCLPLVTKSNALFMSEIQRLSRHNKSACTPIPPYLAGHPVDLKRLYNEVAMRGGHKQVTASHEWAAVYASMGFPLGCIESGHGLRSIYQRFLEPYERCQRMASRTDELEPAYVDTDSQDSDLTSKGSKPTYSMNYLDSVPNHLRTGWNLSTELVDQFDYSSLEYALRSNLPNELDFALNSMLLMSSQPNGFSLHKNVRLLTLLLESVGISHSQPCSHNSDSETVLSRRFSDFWHANVLEEDGRKFLSPSALTSGPQTNVESACVTQDSNLVELHDMAYGDDEGFRVQLVATVLRNLAIEGGLSAVEIGRDPQALRFTFLCIYAKHSSLRQLGLEILSSLHFPVVSCLRPVLSRLLRILLTSCDRNDQIRGLQLVRRLCESPTYLSAVDRLRSATAIQTPSVTRDRAMLTTDRNSEFLSMLPSVVFRCIISRLCLRDLHLVVLALDTVYSLSSLGSVLCERMLRSHVDLEQPLEDVYRCSQVTGLTNILEMLVALLRLEAQSMGSESLVRVRVMQALGAGTQKASSVQTGSQPPTTSHGSDFIRPSTQPNSFTRTTQPSFPTVCKEPHIPLTSVSPLFTLHSLDPNKTMCQPESHTDTLQCPVVNLPRPVTNPSIPAFRSLTDDVQATPVCSVQPQLSLSINTSLCSPVSTVVPRITIVATPVPVSEPQQLSCVQSYAVSSVNSLPTSTQTISKLPSTEVLILSDIKPFRLPHQQVVDVRTTQTCATPPRPSPPIRSALPALKASTARPLRASSESPTTVSHATRRAYMFEWLRKNYAVHSHSTVPRIQIYTDYQQAHQRRFGFNNGGAISPIEFHAELKSIFPGIEQIKVQTPGGHVEIHYHHLKHLNSPEPKSTQGVNDIMAAVLCPRPSTVPVQPLIAKTQKRRKVSIPRNSTDHSAAISLDSDNGPPAKAVPKPIDTPLNGHTEYLEAVNGRTASPMNGLNKDVARIITNPHNDKIAILPNGFQPKVSSVTSSTPQTGATATLSNCPKLNELVSKETGLVLLPVFTTLNFHPTVSNIKGQHPVIHNPGNAQKQVGMTVCISPVQQRVSAPSNHPTNCSSAPTTTTTTVKLNLNDNYSATCVLLPHSGIDDSGKPTEINLQRNPELSQNGQPAAPPVTFVCLWDQCGRTFDGPEYLKEHVFESHYVNSTTEIFCHWDGCSQRLLQTSRDVFVTHLMDSHLSSVPSTTSASVCTTKTAGKPALTSISALLQADSPNPENSNSPIVIPSSPENSNSVEFSLQSSGSSNHTNEPGVRIHNLPHVLPQPSIPEPNVQLPEEESIAGPTRSISPNPMSNEQPEPRQPLLEPLSVTQLQHALWSPPPVISAECRKALAGGIPNPPFTPHPQREGPVTKHIRLTAALALKNFLQYSATARRHVAASEGLLCELAFSKLESAPVIFECLGCLNQHDAIYSSLLDHEFLTQSVRRAGDPNPIDQPLSAS